MSTDKTKLPRGIRNNNPGNLRKSNDPWQGLAPEQTDPDFLQFTAPKWGIRALARTLIAYQDRMGLRSVKSIIYRWAPPTENNTSAYIQSVSMNMGVASDKPINVHDYKILQPLILAIISHENSQQPYSDTEIDAGLILAGVEPPAKPLSQTRTVQGSRVVVGATLAGMSLEVIKDVEPAFPLIQTALQYTPWLLGLLTLAGIGYVVWACIDDRNKGLR